MVFGLNLKEGLLVLFLALACIKQNIFDQRSSETGESQLPSLPQTSIGQVEQVLSDNNRGLAEKKPTHGQGRIQDMAMIGCHLGSEWIDALRAQTPVVLQNMSNKIAYNGHVGRIKNCTNSRLLVAVHGVVFDAEPAKIWVNQRNVRLLEKPLPSTKSVDLSQVRVRASSTRGDYPLHVILEDDDRKWWISKPGSFLQGRGKEYLEFEFPAPSVVRVLGISIPPMPYGPLSVRELVVEAFVGSEWTSVSPRLRTLDQKGLQEVALELIETRRLRVTCLVSAAPMDSVGLFQIAFF